MNAFLWTLLGFEWYARSRIRRTRSDAIRAAKLEALRDISTCDDMTGDRVAKAIAELEVGDG